MSSGALDHGFRPIPGYEGRYEIDFFGEVRSVARVIAMGFEHRGHANVGGLILKQKRRPPTRKSNFFWWHVTLTASRRNAKGKLIQTHEPIARLLWRAFRGPLLDGDVIRILHNQGEACDLRADNLVKIDRHLNRLLNKPDWCSSPKADALLEKRLREQRRDWLPRVQSEESSVHASEPSA